MMLKKSILIENEKEYQCDTLKKKIILENNIKVNFEDILILEKNNFIKK